MTFQTVNVAGRDLIAPTIHLNGSSPETLIEDALGVINPLREAIAALGRAYPNGRDYYPQGSDAIAAACHQHLDRVNRLRTVLAELEAIAESIA